MYACSCSAGLLQRDTPHRRASFFLNGGLAVAVTAPVRPRKPGLDCPLQLVVGLRFHRIRLAESQRFVVHRLLDLRQQLLNGLRQIHQRRADFAFAVSARLALFGFAVGIGLSRTTSVADLSSRNPLNAA